jgi:MFS family permease
VLGLAATAYLMVVLDSTVVITALLRMQRDLHAGLASLGRRRVFNLGLALFTLPSAACASASSIGELVVAHTVQRLAAAVVMPLSLTILTTAFSSPTYTPADDALVAA